MIGLIWVTQVSRSASNFFSSLSSHLTLFEKVTGWARLDNVKDLVTTVISENIEGDYIETGVWRGGSSVYARAVIRLLGEASQRASYVCDSFQGLPPGERGLDGKDKNWDHTPYLEVHSDIVANNFIKYGLLDPNVVFVKGFFNDTMPHLAKEVQKISVMRLDVSFLLSFSYTFPLTPSIPKFLTASTPCVAVSHPQIQIMQGDMYESTVDVLYHLYDKLSVGGYVIIDDWFGFPAKTACEHFFAAHGISPNITAIDKLAAYWKKDKDVEIQYWRYEQSKFK